MVTHTKINVVVPKSTYSELVKRAKREQETVSVIVRRALKEYLERTHD